MGRYEIVRDTDGRWYVMKGERIASGPFRSRASAACWVRPLTGRASA